MVVIPDWLPPDWLLPLEHFLAYSWKCEALRRRPWLYSFSCIHKSSFMMYQCTLAIQTISRDHRLAPTGSSSSLWSHGQKELLHWILLGAKWQVSENTSIWGSPIVLLSSVDSDQCSQSTSKKEIWLMLRTSRVWGHEGGVENDLMLTDQHCHHTGTRKTMCLGPGHRPLKASLSIEISFQKALWGLGLWLSDEALT